MTNLTLYNYFRSSTSYRVRIALHLKNLNFDYKPVHLLNNGGEQNAEPYRTINPMGGVPTLVHESKTLSQSFSIIEYLDEAFPQTYRLFPKDTFMRAKIRQVCENINADIHPLLNLKVLQHLEKTHGYNQEQKNSWSQFWLEKGFIGIEKILTEYSGHYAFGDEITAADLFIVPQFYNAKRIGLNTSPFKILTKINDNCLNVEAFQKAHPYRQIDTPEELKQN